MPNWFSVIGDKMRTIVRLLSFLKPFAGLVLLSVLLNTAAILAGIGLLGTSADLIARAALQPSIAELQVSIVGVRFFGISRAVLRYLERLVSHSVNFRLLARVRVWFYNRVEPLAPARIEDYQSGDLLQRVIGDIESLENFYVRSVAPPLSAVFITTAMGWIVGSVDWRLGLVLVCGLLFSGAVLSLLALRIGEKVGKVFVAAKAHLSAEIVSAVQGISDIIAYSQQESVLENFKAHQRTTSHVQRTLVAGSGLINGLMILLTNLTLVLVLWLAIPMISTGSLEGYRLAVLAIITLASFEAVNNLPSAAQSLHSNLESAKRLFELSDQPPAVKELTSTVSVLAGSPEILEINRLSFRYPARADTILENISFTLLPEKKIALVGESGAGKSTLISVLLRYWDYEEGEVRLNGIDYKRLDPQEIRRRLGVVSASPYIFSATVRQNLKIANPIAEEDELLNAVRLAGLAEWLDSLPDGLDTWVGEHGQLLSGGERQRLAVARALLSKAPFILLDEPTSGLDSLKEMELMNTIFDLFDQRGLLWVTHRLIQMDRLDEIIVLRAGRVIERGKHNRLLAAGGYYAKLWQAQQRLLWEARPDLLV